MWQLSQPASWAPAIHAADPGSFWFWTCILCAIALAGLVAGFIFLQRAWTVETIPASPVRSAAQGYVKLEGRADLMPGPPIISPLTASRCTWWAYKVEKRVNTGRNRGWETVEHGTSDDLFLIRDASGQCVVDPEHAEVIPATENVWYGDEPRPLRGPVLSGFALTSPYRYVEKLIAPQDFIFALGFFRTQGGNPGAMVIDQEVAQLLHTWKQNQSDLLQRFDADHDGQLNDQEWEAARQAARTQVLAQEQQAMQRPPVNVLSKPADGRRFIISTRRETQVVKRFQRWAAGGLLVFVIAGAIAGYMVTTRVSTASAAAPASGPER